MGLWSERNGVLVPYKFGYDAVDDTSKRRRAPRTSTYMEDDELPEPKRKKLIATSRDLPRNFSVAAWAIRKHLDYVSTFSFQCRTADMTFNRRLENLLYWWSRPGNCDVAGRHSFSRFVRLAEEARTVDGDVLLVLLRDGRIQAIEADRITNPQQANSGDEDGGSIVNGVRLNAEGKPTQYAISKRTPGSMVLQFDKWISADNAILLGYYDRFDQVRGISRIAPAINTYQDIYEGTTYALAKAKVSQLFGLVTYRDTSDPLGVLSQGTMSGEGNEDAPRYEVEFGKGPFHLDLEDGDKAEILESKTPPVEFQQFVSQMTASALKSLDIPFSFYDESFTNYSGARQALLQYEQSVRSKREDLTDVLDRITAWKLSQWIAAGMLALPSGVRYVSEIPWEWVPAGIPWIDPLKEVQADVLAVKNRLKSRQQVSKERGQDFYDTADQLAAEEEYLEGLGIPVELAPEKTGGAPMEPMEEPEQNEEKENALSERARRTVA